QRMWADVIRRRAMALHDLLVCIEGTAAGDVRFSWNSTGEVQIVRYAAVDDVGRAINPLILHGQTHGGIAQGVGQAVLENSYYEPESGQMLAASFMDYATPRADTLPFLGDST